MLHANINDYKQYSNEITKYAINIEKPTFHKMKTIELENDYVNNMESLIELEIKMCKDFFEVEENAETNFINFLN